MTPGLLIAAPSSGSGKTTVTLGLIAAFRAMGIAVQPFKCGPDYIDPAFHGAAAGRASFNLDSWAMDGARIVARVASLPADLILAEGAMGLFDGVARPGLSGNGASADVAAQMGWPVVLVLDCGGQAQSAAAVALGFRAFRSDVQVAGVILNRVASARHEALLRDGMAQAGIAVFGALPRRKDLALPERHLGLVQAEESAGLGETLTALGAFVGEHLDLTTLRAAAGGKALSGTSTKPLPPPGQRIALARDVAFSFVYPHLLADWRGQGAEILPFSPLADEAPDPSADACWLPGGYPELHAGVLASAQNFKAGMQEFARTKPVHGECGGYMTLGAGLVDAQGQRHEMLGLLGLETSFHARKMHLGYRLATLVHPIPGLPTGQRLTGHEFHYATILHQPDPPLAEVLDATHQPVAETGAARGLVTGSFFHLIGPAA
jgi:cobyrinic acid a,c-diamide synthase